MLRNKINRTEQEVQEWAGGGGTICHFFKESLEKGLAKETYDSVNTQTSRDRMPRRRQ